jgi:hypothetical protein
MKNKQKEWHSATKPLKKTKKNKKNFFLTKCHFKNGNSTIQGRNVKRRSTNFG